MKNEIKLAGEIALRKARGLNFGAKKGAGALPSDDANRAYERAMRKQGIKTASAKKLFRKSAHTDKWARILAKKKKRMAAGKEFMHKSRRVNLTKSQIQNIKRLATPRGK